MFTTYNIAFHLWVMNLFDSSGQEKPGGFGLLCNFWQTIPMFSSSERSCSSQIINYPNTYPPLQCFSSVAFKLPNHLNSLDLKRKVSLPPFCSVCEKLSLKRSRISLSHWDTIFVSQRWMETLWRHSVVLYVCVFCVSHVADDPSQQ